jgi:hypothetical protein
MRKKEIDQNKNFLKLLEGFSDISFFIHKFKEWELEGYSESKIKGHIRNLAAIARIHGIENSESLLEEYIKSGRKRKIELKYGTDAVKKYTEKLKRRPRPKNFSILTQKYWIEKKGLTKEEAISTIQGFQSRNAKKRNKDSYKNHAEKIKHSVEYWTSRGYTIQEAEVLRKDYLFECSVTLDAFIERHGEEIGLQKYHERIDKFKSSMKESLGSRRTGGYVSKESLQFFVPLYRACRKLGITREEIYFGINGSKEFFFRRPDQKNSGRFVDFCIPSLKLCVEYHGVFWHFKNDETWINCFTPKEVSIQKDLEVKHLCEARGFDYIVVWSDDNKSEKFTEIFNIIKKRYIDAN